MLVHPRRVLAIASLAALAGSLATGVSQSSADASVSFTSQPGVAQLVAHYVVSPTSTSSPQRTSSSVQQELAAKWPKGKGPESVVHNSGGVNHSSAPVATTSTPPASASFIGQQSSATTCSYFGKGCNPPDMALAASPQFVLQGVNTQFEVLDTLGNVQSGWPRSAQSFFGVPNVTNTDGTPCDVSHQSQPFLSDPRALYDAADGRFWAAILQIEGAPWFPAAPDCPFKSVYYIAVSQTSNPSGSWNVYEFEMSMGPQANGQLFGADFTQIGINSQAIYFSANMFGSAGGFYAEVFEANKAQMESGGSHFTADGFFNMQGSSPATAKTGPFLADTVQPTMNLDNSLGTSETFVDTMDGPDVMNGHLCGFTGGGFKDSCSGLVVWTMSNPIGHDSAHGAAPTFSGTLVPSAPFIVNVPADEPSCNQCVDANDLRIPATPVIRNGVLYAAWGTAINAGNSSPNPTPGIEWEQINLLAGISQSNYYSFSGDNAATYPALMPDSHGNLTMIFELMGHKVFPETRFVVKGSGDANFSSAGQLLKAGESSYRPTLCGSKALPVCRWGDFEAASFDGSSGIWFAGEYANQFQGVNTPPAFGRNWGTWIGAIPGS